MVKRIILWVDCKDDGVEQVRERLEDFLAQLELRYKIVDTCELAESGEFDQ
jgi:hypothetical protein